MYCLLGVMSKYLFLIALVIGHAKAYMHIVKNLPQGVDRLRQYGPHSDSSSGPRYTDHRDNEHGQQRDKTQSYGDPRSHTGYYDQQDPNCGQQWPRYSLNSRYLRDMFEYRHLSRPRLSWNDYNRLDRFPEQPWTHPWKPQQPTLDFPPPPARPTSPPPASITSCMRSCPVTTEYNPVCGTNNETYRNPGTLSCAKTCGVDVALKRTLPCTRPRAVPTEPQPQQPPPEVTTKIDFDLDFRFEKT